jgi:hypothetical protein
MESVNKICLVLAVVLCFVGCKKDNNASNQGNDEILDFSSYYKTDVNANPMGIVGDPTDDNKFENWNEWVYTLFSSMDTASLEGTAKGELKFFAAYPNPVSNVQALGVQCTQPSVFKYLLIDKGKAVLTRGVQRSADGKFSLFIKYNELGLTHTTYRLYYSLSAKDNPHYYRAHCDVEVVQ